MPSKRNENRLNSLAFAVAAGRSVASWCGEHKIPKRTAYDWTKLPEFKVMVSAHRRRLIDVGLGKLTKHVGKAVAQIAELATSAESESVRLAAARAILSELIAIGNYADLEARVADLEARAERGNDGEPSWPRINLPDNDERFPAEPGEAAR
jgi:hypothetical protein